MLEVCQGQSMLSSEQQITKTIVVFSIRISETTPYHKAICYILKWLYSTIKLAKKQQLYLKKYFAENVTYMTKRDCFCQK